MSAERLDNILQNLNEKHFNGVGMDNLSPIERARKLCDISNNDEGHRNEQDGYNCELCKNRGYFWRVREYGTGYEQYQEPCKCEKIRQTLNRAKRSGLGNILTDYTFDKFETPEEFHRTLKDKAQEFCMDDNAKIFYIGGQSGSGKTHLCTAIAGHYIKQGKDCRYMLWRDDAVKLKQCVNDYATYQPLINEFKNVDVLYIDDLFKSANGDEMTPPTRADINIAFEIVNHRILDKEKITIISSEFTMEQALEFDEATMGRIYQPAKDYTINIGKDRQKNWRLR